MEKLSHQDVNRRFLALLSQKSPGHMVKLAELGQTWLEDVVLERGFARKILPPGEPVSPEDPQVVPATTHEGLQYLIDLDEKYAGVKLDFVTLPDTLWISGRKAALNFFTIATPIFSYNEKQLLAMFKPISKIIEQDAATYIETIEDELLISAAQACIDAAAGQAEVGDAPITKTHITNLLANMAKRQLKPAKLLLSVSTYFELMGLDATVLGDPLASETFKDGYKHDKILGLDYVLTLKNDIVPHGVVWCFTDQAHLGVMKLLKNPQFFVKEEFGVVEMMAEEVVALGIKICRGVSKLTVSVAE